MLPQHSKLHDRFTIKFTGKTSKGSNTYWLDCSYSLPCKCQWRQGMGLQEQLHWKGQYIMGLLCHYTEHRLRLKLKKGYNLIIRQTLVVKNWSYDYSLHRYPAEFGCALLYSPNLLDKKIVFHSTKKHAFWNKTCYVISSTWNSYIEIISRKLCKGNVTQQTQKWHLGH